MVTEVVEKLKGQYSTNHSYVSQVDFLEYSRDDPETNVISFTDVAIDVPRLLNEMLGIVTGVNKTPQRVARTRCVGGLDLAIVLCAGTGGSQHSGET